MAIYVETACSLVSSICQIGMSGFAGNAEITRVSRTAPFLPAFLSTAHAAVARRGRAGSILGYQTGCQGDEPGMAAYQL